MHHEEKRDPVLQVQGIRTQEFRLPKPEDQKTRRSTPQQEEQDQESRTSLRRGSPFRTISYTGALSSFPSNHLLRLRQIGTQSFHVPSEEEEQEALSSPGATSKAIQGLITAFHNYPVSLLSGNYHNPHHYRTSKCPKPFYSRDASPSISVRLSFT